MEGGIQLAIHSLFLGAIAYLVMVFGLGHGRAVAEDRSALLGGIALVYMVLFGHRLPTRINHNIW